MRATVALIPRQFGFDRWDLLLIGRRGQRTYDVACRPSGRRILVEKLLGSAGIEIPSNGFGSMEERDVDLPSDVWEAIVAAGRLRSVRTTDAAHLNTVGAIREYLGLRALLGANMCY